MRRKLTGILAFGGIGIAVAASASLGIGAFAAESASIAEASATPTVSPTAEIQADVLASATPSASPSPLAADADAVAVAEPSDAPTAASADAAAVDPAAAPLTERQEWLVFQDAVRQCMAGEGKEYLYFEWWNPIYQGTGSDPAMPNDLSSDEAASWALALNGDTGGGADYHWEDAGCWGVTVQQFGNTH